MTLASPPSRTRWMACTRQRRGRERGVLAMKQAHLKTLPPVTGDDAQLSAVQRISRAIST